MTMVPASLTPLPVQPGPSPLKYLVRTRNGTTPEEIEEAILAIGGEHVVGAKVQ